MPPGKRRDRFKAGLKDLFGLNSPGKSSTSLPDTRQPSPSPVPQTSLRSAAPQPGDVVSSVHTGSGSHLPPPSGIFSTHSSALATTGLPPNLVPDSQSPAPDPPPPLSASQTAPSDGEITERSKSAAWSGLGVLLKVVDAGAGVFPPLKEAVCALKQSIDIFESASKGRKDYDELRTKLNALLADLGTFLGYPTSLTMTTSMKNLSIGINEELKLVREKYERSVVRRHLEAQEDAEEIMECYRRIRGHLERLNLNANLTMWRTIDEQATELRLRQLSPTLSAVYNSAESEDVQRRPCAPGTRKQELIRLLDWARTKEAGDVYWMNGMAGTGKTTLAYSLCDELSHNMELGASFFCSRLIPECRNVKLILPAIAYQLARFSHPFRYALSRVLEADPDVHTRVLKTQFESLIAKPLSEAKHTLPADIVVVIDALDECENKNSVEQILDILLAHTGSNSLPVRFLLSSRPEPEIYPRMMTRVGQDFKARLVLHDLDAETVKHDIETYLQTELADVHLTALQLAALVERSGVLFIYASTAARYIRAGLRFKEHEERLNMILDLSSASKGRKDREIDTLYTSILRAVFQSKELEEFSREQTKTLLDTVICAQEPLTVDAIAGFLGLKSGDRVDALLRPLSSVLNIAESSRLVTTLHASFPDYMLNEDRSSSLHYDPKANHRRLAKACFDLIKNAKPFNICKLESSYIRDEELVDLARYVGQAIPSELLYACKYYIYHMELGGPTNDTPELLHCFLSVYLLLWMEVLNLKRNMHLGPRIIQRAEIWSRVHKCSDETIELAHDAWRFVTMFTSHPISQSTPHIYVSILPFWPEASPIAQNYAKHMRGKIKAQGTAISRRQLALLATWSFDHAVNSACFSPDCSLIAFGASSSVFVIDATTGKTVLGPLEHGSTVNSVAFSSNGVLIASGCANGNVQIWNAQNGKTVSGPLTGHTNEINSVAFSPDGSRIVSGSNDTSLRCWNVHSGTTIIGPLKGHRGWVRSVCFSPDGTRFVSGGNDKTLRVWNVGTGEMALGPLIGHTGWVRSVCFSPDGTRIASGSEDQTIRMWSADGGKLLASPLEGHSNYVLSVAFSPDNNQIASGSRDKTIRLWDLNSNPISARTLEGHTGPVTSVAFSSDGSRIVSCSDDKTIRVWDARTRATVADSLEGHTGAVYSVGFSPDGKHIVSGSGDKTIRMWDAESGQMVGGPLEGHTDSVWSVCFSPDGMRITSGSGDGSIRLWDVQKGQTVIGPLDGHSNWVRAICFSPDGALIASGSYDKTIWVWDAQNGKPIGNPLEGHNSYVKSVCFSPDSTCIASGSDDRTIRVWDFRSGQTIVEPLKGHTGIIRSVCFSPNGTRIASGSSDKTARVWDAQSGQPIFDPLEGHTDGISSVCFSPDGTLIVSGSFDKTIRLWDARSGKAIGDPLVGHTGPVWSVAFSSDGMHIVSGSSDQTIRVWDVRGLLRMYGVTDYLPSPEPAPISPHRSHESWVLREDGWAVDPEGHLLVWVPPDLHSCLIRPYNTLIISPNGSLKLDFSSANLGESWAGCYQTLSC